jgi:hypothetical protein
MSLAKLSPLASAVELFLRRRLPPDSDTTPLHSTPERL